MAPRPADHEPTTPGRTRRRRGAVSSMLVVALPTLMLTIGLALEIALVGDVRELLQGAADAAALAGAAELFDQDQLGPDFAGDPVDDFTAAAAAAGLYANLNLALGRPLVTVSDHPALVAFGQIDDPTDRASPFVPCAAPQDACNTLLVTIERSHRRGNPVPVRIGALFGVTSASVVVAARATLDRRVFGVRPIGEIPAPLIPLAADAASWTDQAQTPPEAGVNDNFTVDPRTGEVTPGADGIPEIVLQAPGPGQPVAAADNLGTLALGAVPGERLEIARILREGARPADLADLGGQLALDGADELTVLGRAAVDPFLVNPLLEIRGARRVWPLAAPRSDAAEETLFDVVDFGVGQVVDASATAAGRRVVVVVQPAQLATSTALVRAGRPLNPWLGKVSLTQ